MLMSSQDGLVSSATSSLCHRPPKNLAAPSPGALLPRLGLEHLQYVMWGWLKGLKQFGQQWPSSNLM